jgi:hypothetical protein
MDKKTIVKNKLDEYKKQLSFIKENINNKKVLKEYLNFEEDKSLPPSQDGDRMIDREMEQIPQLKFKALVEKMRVISIDAIKECSNDINSPEYDFFRMVLDKCDKLLKQKKEGGNSIQENRSIGESQLRGVLKSIVERHLEEAMSSQEKARRYAQKHGTTKPETDDYADTPEDEEFDRKWREKELAWKRKKEELGWDKSGSNLDVPTVGSNS